MSRLARLEEVLTRLEEVAKDAAERAAKNSGTPPQLLFAPILFALQDAFKGESAMNRISIANVKEGWRVRHKSDNHAFIVHANYGNRLTAVRTADVTNPSEWYAIHPDTGEVFEIIGDPTLGPARTE